MTAERIPIVGEKSWTWGLTPVEILIVRDKWAWVLDSREQEPFTVTFDELTPPQPTVTHEALLKAHSRGLLPGRLVWASSAFDADAKVELLSDGTWRITPITEEPTIKDQLKDLARGVRGA